MGGWNKLAYWVFKIQAMLLLLMFGMNFLIPLAVTPLISLVWILFGVGMWFIAGGVRDCKRWAPMTALFGTTLPYLIFSVGMNVLQRLYFIYEGPKNPGTFSISFMIWFVVIVNLILSVLLISRRGDFNVSGKGGGRWATTGMKVAIVLLVVSVISAGSWTFWKAEGISILLPFTVAVIGAMASFVISLRTFLDLRKMGGRGLKLYGVSKSVMIISLIVLVLIIPLWIMTLKFTLFPPEIRIGFATIPPTGSLPIDNSSRGEWNKYVSVESQFSIEYPPSWFVDQKTLIRTDNKQLLLKDQNNNNLIAIFLSGREEGKLSIESGRFVEKISLAGRMVNTYGINSKKYWRDVYIPHGDKTYMIQVFRYDSEQVREVLGTFQIL